MALPETPFPRDIILTGAPRCGITLAGALIDSFEGSVCLNEPPELYLAAATLTQHRTDFAKWLVGEYASLRHAITNGGSVADFRAEDGAHLLDGVWDARNPANYEKGRLRVNVNWPNIRPDFTLTIKHHALFTSVLSALIPLGHFRIIAVIRNPIDVILSWQKLPGNFMNRGILPNEVANFWPSVHELNDTITDPLSRMVQLYELFLQQYYELREYISIVRYEDMVRDPQIISELLGKNELPPAHPLIKLTVGKTRPPEAAEIAIRLQKYGVFSKLFYPNM